MVLRRPGPLPGAAPVKLDIPGASLPHVSYLRTRNDSDAIVARAAKSKCVVLIGANFIAMEVASSLAQRKLEVHVVAPDAIPMARVLGPEVGEFLPENLGILQQPLPVDRHLRGRLW